MYGAGAAAAPFAPTPSSGSSKSWNAQKNNVLRIVGLMSIPPASEDPEESRPWFRGLRELRDELRADFSLELPCLSMGMSGDFEIAVAEGATHVRVGSSVFGKRQYKVEGELG
jgi:uncharacterized pyridoxal phosphate-containing UPF0001 family protein